MDIQSELRSGYRFLRFLLVRFQQDNCPSHAASLTYTTLFAVVPMLTVTYSVLALVPEFAGAGDVIREFVQQNVLPGADASVSEHLESFAQQARKLTTLGVAFLFVIALLMLYNVERAFNNIWRVAEPRRGVSSFLMYWAVLSLGPLLVGLAFVLSSYLWTLPIMTDVSGGLGLKQQVIALLPTVLGLVAFTLLFAAVPNTRVPVRHALLGALLVSFAFGLAKEGFQWFVANFPTYRLIYGTFAAVPIFLAWVYVSWVIILFGAILVRSISIYRRFEVQAPYPPLIGCLAVIECFWQRQRDGLSCSEEDLLETVHGLTQDTFDIYANALLDACIIRRTDDGEFVLTRDLAQIRLSDLVRMLPWPLPPENELAEALRARFGWYGEVRELFVDLDGLMRQRLGGSLTELFQRSEKRRVVRLAPGEA